MRYYLIEERLHPAESGASLSGLLFELDNCRNLEQLTHVVGRLATLVPKPEDTDIQRAFLQLVKLTLPQRQDLDLQIEDITKLSGSNKC